MNRHKKVPASIEADEIVRGCHNWRGRRLFCNLKLELFLILSIWMCWRYISKLKDVNPYFAQENLSTIPSSASILDWKNDPWRSNESTEDHRFDAFISFHLYNSTSGDFARFDPAHVAELKGVDIFTDGIWYVSVPGYTMQIKDGPINEYAACDLKLVDSECNIIAADYHLLMGAPFYEDVVYGHSQFAGEKLAHAIYELIKRGVAQAQKVHLVGYSSGGPIAGIAGMFLQKMYNIKLERITGLCPSTVYFEFFSTRDDVLDRTDAEYVDIFHAAGKAIGIWKPVGHVDYYINGGHPHQPQCDWDEFTIYYGCSHRWAVTAFLRILNSSLIARRCNSWEDFDADNCVWTNNCSLTLGNRCPDGVYYLHVGEESNPKRLAMATENTGYSKHA